MQISPQLLLWWLGLGLYLLLMRSFTARRFARGVLISLCSMLLAFAWYLSVWGDRHTEGDAGDRNSPCHLDAILFGHTSVSLRYAAKHGN